MSIDLRQISPPIRLHWLGWQTDTATLGRYGWDISVRELPLEHKSGFDLAIRYKETGHGISGFVRFNYNKYAYDPRMIRELTVNMNLGNEVILHTHQPFHVSEWTAIDPMPQMSMTRPYKMSDLRIFAPLPRGDRRIILPEPSFNEILDKALEMQGPKQKEIRQKQRRSNIRDQALIGLVA